MPSRERLIAKASWWSGWCTDHETELPELTKLGGFLLDVKQQMALDRPPTIEADQDMAILPSEDAFGITHGGTVDDAIMRRLALIPASFQVIHEAIATTRRLEGVIEQKAIEESK